LATVVWMLTKSVRLRLPAVVGWTFVAAAVAFSRVELAVHWTTDVLASVVFATAWLVALAMMFGAVVTSAMSQAGEELAT
jgi:membrane-associated phospholipid phosphatase